MSLQATGRLRAVQQNNVAAGKDPTADEAQQGLFDKLRVLVPSDAVTAYIALVGLTSALAVGWRIAAVAVVAVLSAWWVYYSYWSKAGGAAKNQVRVPVFDVSVGVIAFLAWSTTIPKGPWDELDGFTPAIGLAITVIVSLLLGVAQQAHTVWLKRHRSPERPATA